MVKNISICVLAYNVEKQITDVLNDLVTLEYPIYVIDDSSTDETYEILKKYKTKINILKNSKNLGAGSSFKIISKHCIDKGADFIVKVDGDGQFQLKDVIEITKLLEEEDYDLVKSNRFWNGGIKGDIPKVRYMGNLIATLFLQLSGGTNLLHDPLNGLYGISSKIVTLMDVKQYPKRYGYPFFITCAALVNNLKIYQINNVVVYGNQSSNIKVLRLFITLLRLSFYFYLQKLNIKKKNAKWHRSLILDLVFLLNLLICLSLLILFTVSLNYSFSFVKINTLFFSFLMFLFASALFLTLAYVEEKSIRNESINYEESF